MTTERTTGQAEDVTDTRVSGAYRDLAGERTPASLNERVLREARAHAGSGYSWWMGWLRPAAWVATVGLCLAIVVELTTTQVEDLERPDVPATHRPAIRDDAREPVRKSGDDMFMQDAPAASEELRRQAPARKDEADDVSDAAPGLATPAAPLQPGERGEALGRAAASAPAESKAGTDSGMFPVTDAPILEDAEEIARMREGPGQDPAANTALRSVAARADAAVAAEPAECDDDARSEPESWIDCILDIERRGGNADAERKKFKAAFPDADLP